MIQSSEGTNARLMAVGADDPSRSESPAIGLDAVACDAGDHGLPSKVHSQRKSVIDEETMKHGATNADAACIGEQGFGGPMVTGIILNEADARELGPIRFEAFGGEAEFFERVESIRQEAFAAGLIDGRFASVGDLDAEAAFCGGDGTGKSRRTCANNKEVR